MVNRHGGHHGQRRKGSSRARGGGGDGRIRDLNEQILERIKSGGESALEAHERTLKTVADYQEAAGQSGAEWVTGLAHPVSLTATDVRDPPSRFQRRHRLLVSGESTLGESAAFA